MTKEQIEKNFNVTIVRDFFYSPFRRRKMNYEYIIYTADGNKWENGITTLKEVEKICRRDKEMLKNIRG